MKIEIITIGDEILIGQIVDTNSAWMAQQLNSIGASLERIVTVSDGVEEIVGAIVDAEKRSDVILITGGLGPTKDDVTKTALAQHYKCGFTFHPDVADHIEKLFARFGKKMSELNRLQAELPSACEPLKNNNGTAPGMWFERDSQVLVSMAGVPYEMKGIMIDHVLPRLLSRANTQVIRHRTVLTMGMGESWLSERIAIWADELPPELNLAYLPSPGKVRLRISAKGTNAALLEELLSSEVSKLSVLISDLVYGYDEDQLEAVVGQLLREKGATISTAESCTGGLIAHKLTSVSGSSDYYLGSCIAYSNEVKIRQLGVSLKDLTQHGAVSEQVVLQMAEGARKEYGTDYAIATSGIAGPNGGTDEKPVGTVWIAICSPIRSIAHKYQFGHDRERNIEISANTALNLLRKELLSASE